MCLWRWAPLKSDGDIEYITKHKYIIYIKTWTICIHKYIYIVFKFKNHDIMTMLARSHMPHVCQTHWIYLVKVEWLMNQTEKTLKHFEIRRSPNVSLAYPLIFFARQFLQLGCYIYIYSIYSIYTYIYIYILHLWRMDHAPKQLYTYTCR